MRVLDDVPGLRASRRFALVRRSFAAAKGKFGLRLVKFSVLSNHLHLIVEADDSEALARGMKGLNVRLARALNAALGRKGSLFEDHYHLHLLRTPTEVAHALEYVRTNAERHYGQQGTDWCSSENGEWRELLVEAGTWLLSVGFLRGRRKGQGRWRRAGD
jgi:putative transposase